MSKPMVDEEEERSQRKKLLREDAVRKYVRNNEEVPKHTTHITVANVFGDAYRVNYYGSDENDGVFKTSRIIGSLFMRLKIENPSSA